MQNFSSRVNVNPMQREATTTELAEILDVTAKTICEWAKAGIMEKVSYGKYDLKKSLKNWAEYQRCIFEGFDNPMDTWRIRQEIAWSDAHRLQDVDMGNIEFVPLVLQELPLPDLELDAAGRMRRRAIT
jgi:hypothetical protein